MQTIDVDPGMVMGLGGTNARVGLSVEGDVQDFTSVRTPSEPQEFFDWMAKQVLTAADQGNSWVVVGLPGPVSEDGTLVGPMANVPGLSQQQYALKDELLAVDTAVGDLLDDGFNLFAVNDGELAAQAAHSRIGEYAFDRTGALIDGSGVGAGVVDRDPDHQTVARANRSNPLEIGHVLAGPHPMFSYERAISGPALKNAYGQEASTLGSEHPAWLKVGETVGILVTTLGLMSGVELVVPTGGVGAGASNKYGPHLDKMLATYKALGNETQRLFLPEVRYVPLEESQIFELYGGEGVVRDFMTRDHKAAEDQTARATI